MKNNCRKIALVLIIATGVTQPMNATEIATDSQVSSIEAMQKNKKQMLIYDYLVSLDEKKMGEDFANAMKKKDYTSALRISADYFRNRPPQKVVDMRDINKISDKQRKVCLTSADNTTQGKCHAVGIYWTFPNNQIDWKFDPTTINGPQNNEWVWQFNRHSEWINLAEAWRLTGDRRYSQCFVEQLRSWIEQTSCPEKDWNAPLSAWRTIEAGIRLRNPWQQAFETFRKSPEMTDEDIAMMLGSSLQQLRHLIAHHKTKSNWLLIETSGINAFCAIFPEFKESSSSFAIGAKLLLDALYEQLLPDGLQNELSPDYHSCVIGSAAQLVKIAKVVGMMDLFSAEDIEKIRQACIAPVLLATPKLTQPRTNDCYTISTYYFSLFANDAGLDIPELRWVESQREQGHPPIGKTASFFLPYAGFVAMRSDWSKNAVYLCFDVGPLGCAHIHQDKLNINLFYGEQELLFDDGGGQYDSSPHRTYAVSSYDHNVVIVDNLPQNRNQPKQSDQPINVNWLTTLTMDYAKSGYCDYWGEKRLRLANHYREVRFFKPDFFCVVDTLRTVDKQKHDYEARFQLDVQKIFDVKSIPNAKIAKFPGSKNLLIVPLSDGPIEITSACGRMKPTMAGWFVGRNDQKLHKATTLMICGKKQKNWKLATLLFPFKDGEQLPEIKSISKGCYQVTFREKSTVVNLAQLDKE